MGKLSRFYILFFAALVFSPTSILSQQVTDGYSPSLSIDERGNADTFSPSRLYFTNKKGDVMQLPYEMTREKIKPIKVKEQ